MLEKISINAHSSIRLADEKIIYFDPYLIKEESHDADLIFLSHDHNDHLSLEDIKKVEKESTLFVLPKSCRSSLERKNCLYLEAGEEAAIDDIKIRAIPAYNNTKAFHPKEKGWLGYLLELKGMKIYVAGDTDHNPDNEKVQCDIALLPIGGKFTMDYKEAAALAEKLAPQFLIPTHYGAIIGSKDDVQKLRELVKCEVIEKIA